ncbi:hypothetical protein CHS0354_036289 [Potamilus streckersoni]|uniref:Uncharacterized protein n=1 Tax=Potamilus streckersoni TaxID=2493646 RepID=A0AAE0W737_9BIVA|nr:hypothetical protein CHS0354_036289 [Potamilus streckersoni]
MNGIFWAGIAATSDTVADDIVTGEFQIILETSLLIKLENIGAVMNEEVIGETSTDRSFLEYVLVLAAVIIFIMMMFAFPSLLSSSTSSERVLLVVVHK